MNIILIGFMGSGKTTIGKELAKAKNMEFIDTDDLIESRQGISIKEIFAVHGEPRFREIEAEVLNSLAGIDGHVISVGGGAVMRTGNMSSLKRIGTVVFLDAPLKKIISNLKGNFRPLVGNTIDEDNLKRLLDTRYPTYSQADIIVHTDNLDIKQTVEAILHSLN
ncbi:MAG: Shikimate kinase [Clostridia bacterium]|jgi:shikimate kinase|nr:Shikimate kinase [Clostridia bacterium]